MSPSHINEIRTTTLTKALKWGVLNLDHRLESLGGDFKAINPHSKIIKADSLGIGPGLSVFTVLQLIPKENQVESVVAGNRFSKIPILFCAGVLLTLLR